MKFILHSLNLENYRYLINTILFFKIFIDGPFGAPASNIFRAEHAVLIATGIGVTPFSAILQSIMHRYKDIKRECPRCNLKWNDDIAAHSSSQNLKKVWNEIALKYNLLHYNLHIQITNRWMLVWFFCRLTFSGSIVIKRP